MAHERFRFTLQLGDSLRNLNTNKDHVVHQAVFSDDFLGTHIGLFAHFHGKVIVEDKRKCFECNKIEICLQNYLGRITVGIKDFYGLIKGPPNANLQIQNFSTKNLYTLLVGLQGMNSKFCDSQSQTLKFYEGDIIQTEIIAHQINPDISKIRLENGKLAQDAVIIDTNFYYRDGEDIYIKDGAKNRLELLSKLQKDSFINNDDTHWLYDTLPIRGKENTYKNDLAGAIKHFLGDTRVCKMMISDVYIN